MMTKLWEDFASAVSKMNRPGADVTVSGPTPGRGDEEKPLFPLPSKYVGKTHLIPYWNRAVRHILDKNGVMTKHDYGAASIIFKNILKKEGVTV